MNGKTSPDPAPLAALHDSYVHIQMRLLPLLEDEFGELDDDHRQFVALCQQIEPLFPHANFVWCGNGRPPVPLAMIVTSASVHDSQVAIPLMQRTRERCTVLYDLMDAGYDAEPIRDFSRGLGSVPIIPVNPRRLGAGNGPEMEPDRAERFRRRSGVERFNSHLNDEHGGRTIRVRGHAKVALHLAFGVLVIAVEQAFRLLE